MKRAALLLLAVAACRDWDSFSAHYGEDGGSDAGTDGGSDATACLNRGASSCPSAALFCDGFEAGRLAAWLNEITTGATVTIDNGCQYRGDQALHATVPSLASMMTGGARWYEVVSGTPTPGHQFVRAMVRVDAAPGAMPMLTLREAEPSTNEVRLMLNPGATQVSLVSTAGAIASGIASFPGLSRWVCVEWELDEAADTTRVWLDDGATPAIEGTMGASALQRLLVGPRISNLGGPLAATDVWLDEIVVDDARIHCP